MKRISILLSLLLTLGMLASCGKDKKKSNNNGEVSVSGVYSPQQGQVLQLNGYQVTQQINQFVQQQFQFQAQQNPAFFQQRAMSGQMAFTLVGVINQYGQYNQYNQYNQGYPNQYQWGGNMQLGWGQMPQQGYNPYQQQGAYGMGQIQPTAVHFH